MDQQRESSIPRFNRSAAQRNSPPNNGANAERNSRMPSNQSTPAILRPVILDGSNLAMQMGRKVFCTRGILICARYFIARGHRVMAFVPHFRRNQHPDNPRRPMKDQHLLKWMYDHEMMTFTPSRFVYDEDGQGGRRRIVCYDDNYIVQFAQETGGVVVSNDQFRDVRMEHPEWADTIQKKLVMFSWVGEMFMVAEDPCGRHGPRLNELLRYGENERVSNFAQEWSQEKLEQLLTEIDEALTAPPPPPLPPPLPASAAPPTAPMPISDRNANLIHHGKSSMADVYLLPFTPRFGFARRDNMGFERYVRNENAATSASTSSSIGFTPVETRDEHEDSDFDVRGVTSTTSTIEPDDSETSAAVDTDGFMQWFSGRSDRANDDDLLDIATAIAIEESMAMEQPNASALNGDRRSESPILTNPISEVAAAAVYDGPSSSSWQTDEIDPDQFDYFSSIFPCDIVVQVLKKYKNVKNINLLSNLLADALINQ